MEALLVAIIVIVLVVELALLPRHARDVDGPFPYLIFVVEFVVMAALLLRVVTKVDELGLSVLALAGLAIAAGGAVRFGLAIAVHDRERGTPWAAGLIGLALVFAGLILWFTRDDAAPPPPPLTEVQQAERLFDVDVFEALPAPAERLDIRTSTTVPADPPGTEPAPVLKFHASGHTLTLLVEKSLTCQVDAVLLGRTAPDRLEVLVSTVPNPAAANPRPCRDGVPVKAAVEVFVDQSVTEVVDVHAGVVERVD